MFPTCQLSVQKPSIASHHPEKSGETPQSGLPTHQPPSLFNQAPTHSSPASEKPPLQPRPTIFTPSLTPLSLLPDPSVPLASGCSLPTSSSACFMGPYLSLTIPCCISPVKNECVHLDGRLDEGSAILAASLCPAGSRSCCIRST